MLVSTRYFITHANNLNANLHRLYHARRFSTASASSILPNASSNQFGHSVGQVMDVRRGIALVFSLDNAAVGSAVSFRRNNVASGAQGFVVCMTSERHYIALMEDSSVNIGDECTVNGTIPSVPVEGVGGTVLSPFGRDCTNLFSSVSSKTAVDLDAVSTRRRPSMQSRNPLMPARDSPHHFLSIGYKVFDFFHPLMRGLRVGLIGARNTGKTHLGVEAMSHLISSGQTDFGVYVCVGKSKNEVQSIRNRLQRAGVLDKVTVIWSSDRDGLGHQYLSVFAGCAIADHYRDTNRHCVIVYDDLATHGKAVSSLNRY